MRILLIRKRHLALGGVLAVFLSVFAGLLWQGNAAFTDAFSAQEQPRVTVVVDPGHGGEDGGAVAADGTVESGLNLDIALRTSDLLRFVGVPTVLTRETDISIHDENAQSLREKKASDLQNRVELVNETPNAFLLSIHQNSLPSDTSVHGAQAFYNTVSGAQEAAVSVQEALNPVANTHRAKAAKAISPDIYLMKNVTAPAVLVECGFLSNPEETIALGDPVYQRRLCAAIVSGYLMANEEPT